MGGGRSLPGGGGGGGGGGEPLLGKDGPTVNDVRTIRIETPKGATVVMVANEGDDDWRQTEPVAFPLSGWTVRELVGGALKLRYTHKIDLDDENAGGFGLDASAITLHVAGERPGRSAEDKDEPFSHSIKLGKRTAAGRAFVQIDGKPKVYAVNDDLHGRLKSDPVNKVVRSLRQRSLSQITPGRVSRVRLTREGQTLELDQRDGLWSFGMGASGRVDSAAAVNLVNVISHAYIDRFVADVDGSTASLARYGLDKPRMELEVELGATVATDGEALGDGSAQTQPAAETHRLVVGRAENLEGANYCAMWDDRPVVFTLSRTTIDKMRIEVDLLRDARLTPTRRGDVQSIMVLGDQREMLEPHEPLAALVREGGVWRFGEPNPGYAADSQVVADWLGAIHAARAESYVDWSDRPMEPANWTIRLGALGSAEDEVLAVHDHADKKVAVVRGVEGVGYVLGQELIRPVHGAHTFRDRVVLDVPAGEIVKLHVIRSGAFAADYTFERAEQPEEDATTQPSDVPGGGDWRLEGYDARRFGDLLGRLTPLRATKWLAEPGVFIPEGVTIDITLDDGVTRTLTIHTDAGVAEIDGEPMPFGVDSELVKLAESELRDRAIIRLDAEQIASISVGGVTVRRDDDGVYSTSDGEQLDMAAAGALFDQLAGLAADRFVDVPPTNVPGMVILIEPREGDVMVLRLWQDSESGDPTVGQIDDGEWFTLPAKVGESLSRPLLTGEAAE